MTNEKPTEILTETHLGKKRGACLTIILVLMMVLNPLTGIYYLFAGSTVKQALPSMATWVIPVLIIVSIANFLFAIGIWKWKKWGVYGVVASTILVFLVNMLSIGILSSLLGLVGVVILVLLVRPVWNQMD